MPEITKEAKALRLRNDQIRGMLPRSDPDDRIVYTCGLDSLGPVFVAEAMMRVRTFDDFPPGNDPYGEHDMGFFELSTGDKCIWKIDDYNGHDGIRCVLTVMLASEY